MSQIYIKQGVAWKTERRSWKNAWGLLPRKKYWWDYSLNEWALYV